MNQLKVKYCGNKSFEDLTVTTTSNAQYIGVVFANSKRQVSPESLEDWLKGLNIEDKKLVGVFVNSELAELEYIISKVPLSYIQCHGTESPENLIQIKERTKLPVWKVIHHDENAIDTMKSFSSVADGYVIDTKVKNLWGGSGLAFDWGYVPHYIKEARRQGVPCFVAGGISLENIEILLSYDIDGIDISSGIEVNGKKDRKTIDKIEKRVKQYDVISR